MKKFTEAEIAEIRKNLNNGVVYCGICNGYGFGRILISENKKYIHFESYGQSAVKNTCRDLRWLLETIFEEYETVTPAVWSDYHIAYIPIDKQYDGVDYSTQHPNVYGL